jgi:hypothetical protein
MEEATRLLTTLESIQLTHSLIDLKIAPDEYHRAVSLSLDAESISSKLQFMDLKLDIPIQHLKLGFSNAHLFYFNTFQRAKKMKDNILKLIGSKPSWKSKEGLRLG